MHKQMKLPKILEECVIFENQFVKLYSVKADFGSFTKEYFVTDWGQRVGILVLKNELVLLVRQYRFLINRLSWEIPGGKVDDGETLEAAAMRECLEETGIKCKNLKPLFSYHPGTDVLSNYTHLFYTTEFEESGNSDSREIDSCVWVPFSKCMEMIFSQEIVDVLTITALMSFKILYDKGIENAEE